MRSTPMAAAKTERLLNLVIALLSTRRPLSKAVIRERVAAYREAPTTEAFERMFERDKDELRVLGIPLTTEALDELFDDEPGYRIDRHEYALPDLEMSPEQLSLLALAGRTWSQAALGGAAVRALRKVEAVTDQVAVDPEEGPGDVERIDTAIRTSEPAFEAVRGAVVALRPVRFDYRGRRGPSSTRHVHPWAIAAWHGHWYLTGHDVDRDEPRVFRLDRIEGAVVLDGPAGSYDIPAEHDPRAAIEAAMAWGEPVTARLRVRVGRGHVLRLRATSVGAGDGWDALEVVGSDLRSLADEIVGHGADVVVDGPPELRNAVVTRLKDVVAAHSSPEGEVTR